MTFPARDWLRRGRAAFAAAGLALALVTALPAGYLPAAAQSKALDTELLPLFSSIPSDAELAAVKDAINAVYRKDFAAFRAARGDIADAGARKLVDWYHVNHSASEATPAAIESFRKANPDWPVLNLRERAEEKLLKAKAGSAEVIGYFQAIKPQSGAGRVALVLALLQSGDREAARKLAVETWRRDDHAPEVEAALLADAGTLLTAADHKWRLDRILLNDSRWQDVRSDRIEEARRVLKLLPEAERKKAEARIAVYKCFRGGGCLAPARKAFAALPESAYEDWGLVYHRIQYLRRADSHREAWKLLLKAPTDPVLAVSLDDWWMERSANAYEALYAGDPKTAYALVKAPGALSVEPRKDATFLAGWIALRRLNNPQAAERHFLDLAAAADGPISISQGHYWLGRTYTALGDQAKAREHYREAAKQYTTYYGQLALQAVDKSSNVLALPAPPVPSEAAAATFVGRDAVRAAVIASKAGLVDVMRVLVSHLRYRLKDDGELVLLAHLALSLGDTQSSVRVGKTGMERGVDLVAYAYPTHAMPEFTPLRKLPERAILYALARQESEFNTLAKSGAGARGILQIMPATAKGVCRQYKIACDVKRLSSDPAFNATLASAYVADRHDDFDGSYIMAFAGYNAGPGRVREWVQTIGDPRSASVDPIDWIEMIHLEETREYVKKVLANVQVYRARLGAPEKALRIREDLARARVSTKTAGN